MPTDSLQKWTAIAEIVSAAVVVVSLIYVGYEIRQSSLESDADVQAELLSYSRDRRVLVIENADLARILIEGYADQTALTPEEKLRFNNYVELHYVAWERAFLARDNGVLSDENWIAWDRWFAATASQDPDFVWERVRHNLKFDPFLRHVDSALERTGQKN